MDFSELYKQTNQNCKFSPNGKFLANSVQYKLIIRDVRTLQIVHLYTCLDAIQAIEWSTDSGYVLCGMYKRGLVQVWSMSDKDWSCKIDEGSAGLVHVTWSPDGRHILNTAQFHIRVTVWSLVTKMVLYMKHPKQCQKGYDFSSNGKYLALAERRSLKDFVSIFDVEDWHLLNHFETDTEDLATVQWSPDSQLIAVSESCFKYNILLYSLDGRCLSSYSAGEIHAGLGIKSLSWSPTSQFIAIGSFDEKVRLLNHLTWTLIAAIPHPSKVDGTNVTIYKEEIRRPQLLLGETAPPVGMMFSTHSRYETLDGPTLVPIVKPDPDKANPKIGVGSVQFSSDATYFYTINDNMPSTLWIWDVRKLSLVAILIQDSDINEVCWAPDQCRLALCTSNNKLYMWSPAGALSVEVPAEVSFQTTSIHWHPDGDALLLVGKTDMCLCFLQNSSQNNQRNDEQTISAQVNALTVS